MEDSKPNKQVSGLSFAEAMEETRTTGSRVQREAWSVLDGFVKYKEKTICPSNPEENTANCLMIRNAGGNEYIPYNPTTEDIFACDWRIEVK